MATNFLTGLAADDAPLALVTQLPPLENGDHLDQATFHARYQAMPEHVRAELIEGIVFTPSPIRATHSEAQAKVLLWLSLYEMATPSVRALDAATVILGDQTEVQPDACLLLSPAKGGRVREVDEYLHGPPELVVEVASSSESYDLHGKKTTYQAAGVREYVVVALRQNQVHWFALRDGDYLPLAPGNDGLYRSEVFPGLWLDPAALLAKDAARLAEAVRLGLTDESHAQFVKLLAN